MWLARSRKVLTRSSKALSLARPTSSPTAKARSRKPRRLHRGRFALMSYASSIATSRSRKRLGRPPFLFCLSLPRYALYRSSGGSGCSQPSSPDDASSASISTPAAAPSRKRFSFSFFPFFLRGVRSCVRKKKNCTTARLCAQYSSVSPALRIRGIPCVRGE
jgi:hypothetical protein